MSVVAVDLAAKYSAACLMSMSAVSDQWDSWQKTETAFIDLITWPWKNLHRDRGQPEPLALIIEDLPQHVPYMTVVKDVLRLQGRIVERMHHYGYRDQIVFVPPAEWRAYYALKRGSGPQAIVDLALDLNYQPPELLSRAGKGEKGLARKVVTDYCAAFLIGRWALQTYIHTGTFDAPRTARYGNL